MHTTMKDGQNGQYAARQQGTPTTISVILNCLTCGMIPKDYKEPPPAGPTKMTFNKIQEQRYLQNVLEYEENERRIQEAPRFDPQANRSPIPTILITPPQ
ncbi:hypothetical protein PspLS_06983 [Pyricularia sp. CBS 133598]|nr:hypothetical protein PspLS_06983 [Pyricularia sp. CBS 133598]